MYKITLPINYDGVRYGINFFKGVGYTDKQDIINLMKKKGFAVEKRVEPNGKKNEKAHDSVHEKTTD